MPPGVEPPYRVIWDLWKRGEVLPVLGAGATLAFQEVGVARPPLGRELAQFLASDVQLSDEADYADLAEIASYYAAVAGRRGLNDRLREVMTLPTEPNPLHRFLASSGRPQFIIVTTQDTALEQAFDEVDAEYDVVVHQDSSSGTVLWWQHGAAEPLSTRSSDLDIDLTARNVIYKPFGSIDRKKHRWDSFIIAEEDLLDLVSGFLRRTAIPPVFQPHIAEKNCLYLGFGLRSWVNRTILRALSSSREVRFRVSWAIVFRPKQLESMFCETQNVRAFDLHLREFVKNVSRFGEPRL